MLTKDGSKTCGAHVHHVLTEGIQSWGRGIGEGNLSNSFCVGRNLDQTAVSSEMGQVMSYQGQEYDLPCCNFMGKSKEIILINYLLDSPFFREVFTAKW